MTRKARRSTRSKGRSQGSKARLTLDPLFAGLIFVGVGLGTLGLGTSARLAVLWATLGCLWLLYREGTTVRIQYEYADLGRGALIGLAISVPLVLLAFRALLQAIPILFVSVSQPSIDSVGTTTIFVSLVLLAPLTEELFFRDIVQRERGLWLAVGFYAVAGLVLFLPTAGEYPAVLLAVTGTWAALGAMYSFFHERFGLATTIACHLTINLVLLYIPAVLDYLGLFTQ